MARIRMTDGTDGVEDTPGAASLVEALIRASDVIATRYHDIAKRLPYSRYSAELPDLDVAELTRQLAAATWQRIGEELPSYGFAEEVGRRLHKEGAPLSTLLLHWQILRRAIHLVLAEKQLRTGGGGRDKLRQAALMNYTLDWATEASLVGYVLAGQDEAREAR